MLENEFVKNIKKGVWESFVASLLLIVFALVLLYNPENFLESSITTFGYIGFFLGVINIMIHFKTNKDSLVYKNNFQTGLILICASIIAFFKTSVIKEFIAFILGGYLIYRGSLRASLSMNFQEHNKKMSFVILILALLMILNPFTSLIKINELIAILIIINEVLYMLENIIILIKLK